MSTLQVHITAGPQAGARFQLNTSPVSFGRSPDNTLVLDVAVVSRQHGELVREDDGTWTLINHSSNGTRVGRKKVTKKPYPLSDGVPITIGDTEVFRVHLVEDGTPGTAANAPTAEQNEPAQQPATNAPGAGLKGKSKLWIGLGVWIGLCVVLMIVGALTLGGDGDDNKTPGDPGIWNPGQTITDVPPGPDADIADVKRLLEERLTPEDPNDTLYDQHLADARDAYELGKQGLFDAYRHYQQAISYAQDRDDPLDSLDQIKYGNVMNQLAEIIAQDYRQAWRFYNQGKYPQAAAILDDLRRDYYDPPEQDDTLANHIKRLRNAAHSRGG
ncbi:MAG: FHA domain-containing protein [Phycisphaeraceae bacterium]